jgi:hypothetical protein
MAEYEIYLAVGTTTTLGTGKWRFSLDTGNGHALDTGKLLRSSGSNIFGRVDAYDSSANAMQTATVAQFGTSTTLVMAIGDHTSGLEGSFPSAMWDADDPISWEDGDYLSLRFSVPISGWSG